MCRVANVCVATGFWEAYSAVVLKIIRGKLHVTVFSYLSYYHSSVLKDPSGWLVVPHTVHVRRDISVMSTTDLYMHVQPTLERPLYFL